MMIPVIQMIVGTNTIDTYAIGLEVAGGGGLDELAEEALHGPEGVVVLHSAEREKRELQHALDELRRRAARSGSGADVDARE